MIAQNIHLLDSLFAPPQADMLKLQLVFAEDLEEQKAALQQIMSSMSIRWCKEVANHEYAQIVERVAEVNKVLASSINLPSNTEFGERLQQTNFGATLYKAANISGEDFLAGLKMSFPDKAIIFDRWATWCGPCLEEMPHSKKLQLESSDLPVVFIYACTANGSDENKWKRKVTELGIPGIHIFIDEALDVELTKYFSFQGYPGYALIDRRGVYKPSAIRGISLIKNREELNTLIR